MVTKSERRRTTCPHCGQLVIICDGNTTVAGITHMCSGSHVVEISCEGEADLKAKEEEKYTKDENHDDNHWWKDKTNPRNKRRKR